MSDGGVKIAVVGMAVRVPGASTLDSFWSVLEKGQETVTRFTETDLINAGLSETAARESSRVRAFGALDDADLFDAEFFGFTPREAEILDPQHRIFLETAARALEDSGCNPDVFPGRIGVFGGVGLNSYLIQNILENPSLIKTVGAWPVSLGNDKDFVPTRVAYKLDLQGPAVSVNTACSTSLVSVILGSQSLLNYQSDLVLCGGCSIHLPQDQGYEFHPGGILSPDGKCRPFDKNASGTFDGNGAAIVGLKRLDDAQENGDRIYSVISGFGINNDGSLKAGFTAPSVDGQAEVIRDALEMSGRSQDEIGFVEAHGTGTPLGDEIELKALDEIFSRTESRPHYLGSLKSNFGHLDTAAGAASLIKVSLALRNGIIPPTATMTEPSQALAQGRAGFVVNTDPVIFPRCAKFSSAAGVSSFGIGGTNAHIILEEAPPLDRDDFKRDGILIPVSAPDQNRLGSLKQDYDDSIFRFSDQLHNFAHSVHQVVKQYPVRGFYSGASVVDGVKQLVWHAPLTDASREAKPKIIFLFGGRDTFDSSTVPVLIKEEPEFRKHFFYCIDQLERIGLAGHDSPITTENLRRGDATNATALSLFCAQYATYLMWRSWGVQPDGLFGVSLGEFVVATISEVLSLDDALRAVAFADSLSANFPAGKTVAVGCGAEQLKSRLPEHVYLSVSASANQSLLSGDETQLNCFCETLRAEGLAIHEADADAPFHTPLMTQWVDKLVQVLDGVTLNNPKIPYVSCATGAPALDSDVTSVSHYRKLFECESQIRAGLESLSATISPEDTIFLENGIGASISSFVQQSDSLKNALAVLSTTPNAWALDSSARSNRVVEHLYKTIGSVWQRGTPFDFTAFSEMEWGNKIDVPKQPFVRHSFWVNPRPRTDSPELNSAAEKRLPIDSWFHAPQKIQRISSGANLPEESLWILVGDSELLDSLSAALTESGINWRSPNDFFESSDEFDFSDETHWKNLFDVFIRDKVNPTTFVFCPELRNFSCNGDVAIQTLSPMIFLGRYLGATFFSAELTVAVVVENLTDSPRNLPADVFLGPIRVLPQEFQNVNTGLIEVSIKSQSTSMSLGQSLVRDIAALAGSNHLLRVGRLLLEETYPSISLARPQGIPKLLRHGGVYLITGGLGRIGTTLASHLINTLDAKVILTTRGRLGEVNEFPLKTRHPNNVLVLTANAESEVEMFDALNRGVSEFGNINGVIHAAGIIGAASFKTISESSIEDHGRQFEGKVGGLPIIEKLSQKVNLDFVVLCSSLSPLLGGLGFSAYGSANAILDRYVDEKSGDPGPIWISINWEGWQELAAPDAVGHEFGKNELTDEEGCDIFDRIMDQSNVSRIVVSTTRLSGRLQKWVSGKSSQPEKSSIGQTFSRPSVLGSPIPASSSTEQRLINLWEQLLGISPLGVSDNFFEVGGNSLILTQFIATARDEFQIDLPLAQLFDCPRIDSIAKIIDNPTDLVVPKSDSREQGLI
jgi:acyl transferase domain-containing protein